MRLQESITAAPVQVPQSIRRDQKRFITSGHAGKILPLAYFPILREDRLTGGFRVNFEMMETAEMLLNAVNVSVYAHFIPYLASDRFNGMDQLNRAYMGVPEEDEGPVKDFIETIPFAANNGEIWRTMGVHASASLGVNAFPVEAYNILVNFRRKARSEKLPERDRLDTSLARAFWRHTSMAHIVPDFDAAMIDGEVLLQIENTQLPVQGVLKDTSAGAGAAYKDANTDEDVTPGLPRALYVDHQAAVPRIYAELEAQGVKLSLSTIEQMKKTTAWAMLRRRYSGLSEEHTIDLLMEGIRVPEEQLTQPILLDRKQTVMGYNRRYATDAANLDQSVTNGETYVDLMMRTPKLNTGGLVMITAEIVPEQMFERQKDYYLYAQTPEDFPNATRDYLDPEKVAIVANNHCDVLHTDPNGTFGYAPLNHEWKRDLVNVGGKYYRPEVDASFDEERQKFWAVEYIDPELTEDFYLVGTLHNKVFADTTSDPFEISGRGGFQIVGNTQFGKGLHEDTDDYERLMEIADSERAAAEHQTGGGGQVPA